LGIELEYHAVHDHILDFEVSEVRLIYLVDFYEILDIFDHCIIESNIVELYIGLFRFRTIH